MQVSRHATPQSTTLWLHPVIHVPNYMDHYSFTDHWGMDGWVGHVGWPLADVWPTKCFSGCALKLTLLTVGLSNLRTIDTEPRSKPHSIVLVQTDTWNPAFYRLPWPTRPLWRPDCQARHTGSKQPDTVLQNALDNGRLATFQSDLLHLLYT